MERACVLATDQVVVVEWSDLGGRGLEMGTREREGRPTRVLEFTGEHKIVTLDENERTHIRRAMQIAGGRIHGPGGAANMLGINPSTLRSRMQKLGIEKQSRVSALAS